MISRTNIFSGIAMIFFGIIIVILLFIKPIQCNKPVETSRVNTSDTNRRNVDQPIQYVPVYVPQPQIVEKPVYIPQAYQVPNNATQADVIKKYNDLAEKFLEIKTYKDSITLRDSAGNRVGVFNNNDVVTQNEIKSRNPSYKLSFPLTTITNTTTITQTYPSVNKLFVLGEITGNATLPYINGANVGVMFLNKKDNGFYLKAGGQMINNIVQPQFQIGKAWKISLKK